MIRRQQLKFWTSVKCLASLHTCVHIGIPGSGICSFVLIGNAKVDLLGAFTSVCPLAVWFLVGHAQSAISCICLSVFDSTPAPVAIRTSLCQCYCDCMASGYCPEMNGGGMCTASSYSMREVLPQYHSGFCTFKDTWNCLCAALLPTFHIC